MLGIQWYFQLLADRVQEYVENCNKLEKFATEHSADSPACKLLAEAIVAGCAEIRKELLAEGGKDETFSRKWQDAFWEKQHLILKEWKTPVRGPMGTCQNTQIDRGDSVDSFVCKAGKSMRRIISAAYILGSTDEASLKMATKTIRMCHDAIRFSPNLEEHDNIDRSQNNPMRLAVGVPPSGEK